MSSEFTSRTVKLRTVSKEESQAALDKLELIFDGYGLPDDVRLNVWELYQTFASDILLRFGEFSPDVGYPEQNGHA